MNRLDDLENDIFHIRFNDIENIIFLSRFNDMENDFLYKHTV